MPFLSKPFLDSTRGRIMALLRAGGATAEELAARLHITRSAVRAHVAGMERDGLIRRAGLRPGKTRPSLVFELAPEIEQRLSGAYVPLVTELVGVLVDERPPAKVEKLLRRVGKRLADALSPGNRPSGDLAARATQASHLLNDRLGAVTRVEVNGRLLIRGTGCVVSAVTARHPGACLAIESLLSELVGAPVRECCTHGPRPQCCFEIRRGSVGGRPAPPRGAGPRRGGGPPPLGEAKLRRA